MANGIYTQPIPFRDPNEDLQFLAGVLQNQAALRAKNDAARQKAFNDQKERLDKLSDSKYDFDLSEIPSGFRQAFSDKLLDSQQKFKYYSAIGDEQAAMQEVLGVTNDFNSMKEYGEKYDPLYDDFMLSYSIANETDERVKASKTQGKADVIGVVYDKDYYTQDKAAEIESIANGSIYNLSYDSGTNRYVFYGGMDPKDNFVDGIVNLEPSFNQEFVPHLVINNLSEFADRDFLNKDVKNSLGGETYGARFYYTLNNAETKAGAAEAIKVATEDYEARFNGDFTNNDPSNLRGVQLRMRALIDFPEISEGLSNDDKKRFIAGDFGDEEKTLDATLVTKSKELQDATREFIQSQMYQFFDVKPDGSGRKGTDKTLYYLEQGIGFRQGPTGEDQRGVPIPETVEIEVPLDFQEDRRFRFNIQEGGETFTIQGPTAVAFKFSDTGKLQGMTLQGVVKTKPTSEGSQGTFEEVLDYDVSVTDDNFVEIFTAINQQYAEAVKKPLRDSMDDRIEEERGRIGYLEDFKITQNFSDLSDITGQSQSSGI
jgi:hypothetical protein